MMDLGTLLAKIGVDASGVKKAEAQVKASTDRMDHSLQKPQKSAEGLKTALMGVGVGFAAIQTGRIAADLLKTASAFEEMNSKFEVVFRGVQQRSGWLDTLTKDFAMSGIEARKYMASMQDMFVPMGMAREEAAKLSFEVVKLGMDLGSFNNAETEEVLSNMTSAFARQYEVMRKYGVDLSEASVKQEAYRAGLAKTGAELTAQQRIMATYSVMLNNSSDALGDMKRTKDSFANTLRDTSARWIDLKVAIGNEFLPAAKEALITTRQFFLVIKENAGVMKEFVDYLLLFGKIAFVGLALKGLGSLLVSTGFALAALNMELKTFIFMSRMLNIKQLMTTPLYGLSVASRLAAGSLTKLGLATTGLFWLWAGWEIGTVLYEKFRVVRELSIGLTDGLVRGFLWIEKAWDYMCAALEFAWDDSIITIKRKFSEFIDLIGMHMKLLPGLSKAGEGLQELAGSIKPPDPKPWADYITGIEEGYKRALDAHEKWLDYSLLDSAGKIDNQGTGIKKKKKEPAPTPTPTGVDAKERLGDLLDFLKREKEVLLDQFEYKQFLLALEDKAVRDKYAGDTEVMTQWAKTRAQEEKKIAEEKIQFVDDLHQRELDLGEDALSAKAHDLEAEDKMMRKFYSDQEVILKQWSATYLAEQRALAKEKEDIMKGMRDRANAITMSEKDYKLWALGEENKAMQEAYAEHQDILKEWARTYEILVQDAQGSLFKALKEGIKDWANSFSDAFADMLTGAEMTFKDIADSFLAMITKIMVQKMIAEPIGEMFESLYNDIFGGAAAKTAGSSGAGAAVGAGSAALEESLQMSLASQEDLNGAISATTNSVKGFGEGLMDSISEIGEGIWDFASDFGEGLMDSLGSVASGMGEFLGEFGSGMMDTLGGLGSGLMDFLGGLGSGLMDFIGGLGSMLGDMMGGGMELLGGIFSAKGNVFSGPGISAYSNSLVSRATPFLFAKGIGIMGEKGTEAILPTQGFGSTLGIGASLGGKEDQALLTRLNNGNLGVSLDSLFNKITGADSNPGYAGLPRMAMGGAGGGGNVSISVPVSVADRNPGLQSTIRREVEAGIERAMRRYL